MTIGKIIYIVCAYLLGSILFSELSMRFFCGESLAEVSKNHNPGASNAFACGGVMCGIVAVIGDVGKGFLPVFFYERIFNSQGIGLALTIIAAAMGHAYPFFYHFKGGMCISVSFGILFGLLPCFMPLLSLIVLYLALLAVNRNSTSYISIIVFSSFILICLYMFFTSRISPYVLFGLIVMSCLVCIRMWSDLSESEQDRMRRFMFWSKG